MEFYGSKVDQILSKDEPISSIEDLEEVLLKMRDLVDKIDHFKQLKKSRVEPINEAIEKAEGVQKKLRDKIVEYHKSTKRKTFEIPGVAKTSLKNIKGKWPDIDEIGEDEIVGVLKEFDMYKEIVTEKISINKTKLNKFFNDLESNNNLPSFIFKDGENNIRKVLSRKDNEDSISISWDDEDAIFEKMFIKNVSEVQNGKENASRDSENSKNSDFSEFDNLEI